MNKLKQLFLATGLLAAGALAAFVVVAQTTGAGVAELSAVDVQTYIELNHSKLIEMGDKSEDAYRAAVDSALEFFWRRPELVASALLSLDFQPTQIALMFVDLGVPVANTATAVITAAGTASAVPVKEALLLTASPAEVIATEAAVTEVVAKLTNPVPQPEVTVQPVVTAQLVEEPTTTAPVTETRVVVPTEPVTVAQIPVAEPVPVPVQEVLAPAPVVPVVLPTPPSTGGMGTTSS